MLRWKLIHSWFVHENLVSNEYRGQIDCKKISNTKLTIQVLVQYFITANDGGTSA